MFRIMKLNQNLKGKVLSFAVSLAVLALTIVGAFAVNFSKTSATNGDYILSFTELKALFLDEYPQDERVDSWFLWAEEDLQAQFENNEYFICAALGAESKEMAITIWKWSKTPNTSDHPIFTDGWATATNGNYIYDVDSGYRYSRIGFIYSDISNLYYDRGNNQPSVSINDMFYQEFDFGLSSDANHLNQSVLPKQSCRLNGHYKYFASRPTYAAMSDYIQYQANFIYGPYSAYNNICFAIGQQYYFTFSDQSILLNFIQNSGNSYVPVTFQKNGSTITYNYYFDELFYTGRSSVNGVINVGAGGVLAWNITPLVSEYYFDSVVHSNVEPASVYKNYFADNEAIISWVPYQDPAAQYEYYLEQFQNIVGHSYVANPNELPSYITSGNVGFSQDINAHVILTGSSAGKVYFDSVAGQHAYDPNVLPNSILIISSAMFDTDFSDELTQEDQDVFDFFTGLLTPDVDLIVVLDHSKWTNLSINVTQGQSASIMSAQDADYFIHNSYYQDWSKAPAFIKFYFTKGIEDNFLVNEGVNSFSGMVYATQRYYTRITNAILAEGFNGLQNALDTITTNQNTFFTGAINSIGAAVYAIDTVGGKLDSIYKYLRYDVDLSDKLTKIVDKLEKIADNTDEQMHDYWFISLYNWLLQFAPSNSDFATWVSDLTSFENQLPDPEATPAATVIPFPTVTDAAG